MKIQELLGESVIGEAPLPDDWDQAAYGPGTTFKSRLAYALERAKKLGTGSSRVATIIEYQGRPTVLKIAKNGKGLAQNSSEIDILDDGYASQLGILIPLIDFDKQNREPTWIQTEKAEKATEKQLCAIMKCPSLGVLVDAAYALLGKYKKFGRKMTIEDVRAGLIKQGYSEDDIEIMFEYVNKLAELNSSFDMELGDFTRAANWGLFQGKPVIIDAGFTSGVLTQYYS